MVLRIHSITKATKLLTTTTIPRINHRVLYQKYGQRHFMNRSTFNMPMNNQFILKASPLTTTYRSFHSSLYHQAVKPFLLADIGEGITECEVIQWFVEPGATVAEFDKICEVQSDKASVEITSRFAGKVTKVYHNVHDIAKVGEPLVDIETTDGIENDGSSNQEVTSTTTTTTTTTTTNNNNNNNNIETTTTDSSSFTNKTTGSSGPILATPPVRHLAKENNVDLSKVNGSGPDGRILKQDVLDFIAGKQATASSPASKSSITSTINTTMAGPGERSEPLTAIQKAMFKSMTKSLSIPQLGYKDEIELNATSDYKNSLNTHISKHPEAYSFSKISFLPIFIKCMSIALLQYPILNASITNSNNIENVNVNEITITYRPSHNIGIAMDTPQGLIVPNIKNVQTKTIFEVASELSRLIELGKKNAIPLEDLKGGTITLSNIGAISGTYASPVVVSSELAIVALGRMQTLPRFDDKGNVIAKQVMPVSWSADHRIIDGATIARFGNLWKTLIENPALLASELR